MESGFPSMGLRNGVPKQVVIAGVAALVFEPKKLPEVGKNIGKIVKSFQQVGGSFRLRFDIQVASLTQNRIEERNFEMLRTENKLPKKRNIGAAKLALKNNGLAYPCYSDSAKAARKYAHTMDGVKEASPLSPWNCCFP
ncbi:hypothetical protein POTOM_045102 [Populus tomentosa]|uniref:Uncharacterized protein n=1 Tax=Populus tomentosa TaxID=118781 RepID=A0A8X7YLB4_POPTO|nr:hypothetical protein POTOM_045102 [Populus tomentosa]